jgi:hypothetical protein
MSSLVTVVFEEMHFRKAVKTINGTFCFVNHIKTINEIYNLSNNRLYFLYYATESIKDATETFDEKSEALKREAAIKRMSRKAKAALIGHLSITKLDS